MTPAAEIPANDEAPEVDLDFVVLLAKLGAAGAEAFERDGVLAEAA